MGRKAIIEPALQEKYGKNYLEKFKEKYGCLEAIDAAKLFKEETGTSISPMGLWAFAKKNGITFQRTAKAETGKSGRGRKESLVPGFIEKAGEGNKDKAIEYLKSLCHMKINDALPQINKDLGTDYEYSHVYQLTKALEVTFKGKRKGVRKEGDIIVVAKTGTKTAVHISCQKCDHRAGRAEYIDSPDDVHIKGSRCKKCGKWDTPVATFTFKGEEYIKAVVPVEISKGITIDAESIVDENMEPIKDFPEAEHGERENPARKLIEAAIQ